MTITAKNNEIGEVYFGLSAISEVYHGNDLVWSSGVTLTVNPTPSNATVTFNASGQVSGNSIKVKKGTTVSYTVSCSGYYSTTGSITVNQSQTINVALEEKYYDDDQVIFEQATAGSYNATILAPGLYEIIAVGGGGGCGQMALGGQSYTIAVSASGGSGAVVQGIFRLSAGTLPITVGALGTSKDMNNVAGESPTTSGGSTTVGTICSVGGGGGGKAGWGNPVIQQGGAAGVVNSYDSAALVSSILISNGNAGTFNRWYTGNKDGTATTSVVQSPYPPYGSGSAGSAVTRYRNAASFSNSPGSAGYVKIIYKGK